MRYRAGERTTIMCDKHAARASKFPNQFLSFKMIKTQDEHCKWCDKDASAKTRIINWAKDNGIKKVMTDTGIEIGVEDWIDLMIETAGDV